MKFLKLPIKAKPEGPKNIATILEDIIPDKTFAITKIALNEDAFTMAFLELNNLNFINKIT